MVEVAEEFIEAMHRGEKLVSVSQMVLSELAGGVAQRLQQFRHGWIFRPNTGIRPGHADLGEASADRVLAGNERGPAGRAALLAVVVGEGRTFVPDPIDVGGPV